MKIGIITVNTHTNYGGILQAYALQKTLTKFGHNVKVIYNPVIFKKNWKYPIKLIIRCIQKFIFSKNIQIFFENYNTKHYPIVSQYTQDFINRNIEHIEIDNFNKLKEEDWDAFVVGSDQIWRPDYCSYYFPNTFLNFAKKWKIKRFAYAVSFGTDRWLLSHKQTKICRKLAKKFDFITVRETSAINLCEQYLTVKTTQVLDPTLLLDKNEYIELINKYNTNEIKGNLLTYILDYNTFKGNVIDKVSKDIGLKPFSVNSKYEDFTAPLKERIQPPVELWLKGFNNADFIITDSFHACVFSLIFHKPFIVIGNKDRGLSRFESLLNTFNLNNRLILNNINEINYDNINWDIIDAKLNNLRINSFAYLKDLNNY